MSAAAINVDGDYARATCGARFLTVKRSASGYEMDVAAEVELRTGGESGEGAQSRSPGLTGGTP